MKHNQRRLYSVKAAPMLAVALVAGGSLMCAPQAHAGTLTVRWKFDSGTSTVKEAATFYSGRLSANYQDQLLVTATRQTTYDGSKPTNSSNPLVATTHIFDPKNYPVKPSFGDPNWVYKDGSGRDVPGAYGADVGGVSIINAGSAQTKATYHAEVVWTGALGEKPPARVALRFGGSASAYAVDNADNMSALQGQFPETVSAKVTLDKDTFYPTPAIPVTTRSASASGETTVLLPLQKNSANEWVAIGPPVTLEAQAAVPGNRVLIGSVLVSGYPTSVYKQFVSGFRGQFRATGSHTVGQGYLMDVTISSGIETSWKKFTGSVADLPDAYKQRDANGAVINQPNGNAVPVSANATDASKSIWKIACQGDPDGSISVESAAQSSNQGNPTADQHWYGGSTLTANWSGFSSPHYKWSLTGGSPLSDASNALASDSQSIALTQQVLNPGTKFQGSKWSTYPGVDLGVASSTPTSSSVINVTVSDSSIPVSLNNKYTVKWHTPTEGWHKYAPDQQHVVKPSLQIDNPGYAINNAGIGVQWNYEPAKLEQLVKVGGQLGAGLVWAFFADPPAVAAIAAVTGVAFAVAPTTPSDHAVAMFDSCWDDSRSTWDRPPTDYSALVPTTGADGNPLTEKQRQDWIKQQTDVGQDKYHMTPEVRITYTDFSLEADGYDQNGYAGLVHTTGTSPNTSGTVVGKFVFQDQTGIGGSHP